MNGAISCSPSNEHLYRSRKGGTTPQRVVPPFLPYPGFTIFSFPLDRQQRYDTCQTIRGPTIKVQTRYHE